MLTSWMLKSLHSFGRLAMWVALLSVLFAVGAAGFWGKSALVDYPVIDNSYVEMVNIEPFYATLKRVARLNACAAGCALLSAVFQAITLYLTFNQPMH